jgi:hypothetical protein
VVAKRGSAKWNCRSKRTRGPRGAPAGEGDELRCSGSKKALTPELLDKLRVHKGEIIKALRLLPRRSLNSSRGDVVNGRHPSKRSASPWSLYCVARSNLFTERSDMIIEF